MSQARRPVALVAAEVAPRERASNYPEPFASRMAGRIKRPLGDPFGLANFGVNLTTLRPGAVSSLRHAHSRQDPENGQEVRRVEAEKGVAGVMQEREQEVRWTPSARPGLRRRFLGAPSRTRRAPFVMHRALRR